MIRWSIESAAEHALEAGWMELSILQSGSVTIAFDNTQGRYVAS